MKKLVFLSVYLLSFIVVFADEGMWIPLFLDKYNIEEMQEKGFKLTASDIYDVNQASLKDAVMVFGGGCTAELISDKGLILTNHHCGFSNIQSHSTVEHDYLTDGFWAGSMDGELPNPGLTVTFLIYMEDVSKRVLAVFDETMSMDDRDLKIDSVCTVIENEIVKKNDGKYDAVVESFFYGNQFIVMVTQEFKDIRLVGAPPSSIGKFGGDTDNWVWPRHTGDFSMFRIYADKNNNPAEYSPENKPYKPKKFFPINIGGVQEGDFTMIFGYPGHTQEYIPSFTVDNIINLENPDRIKLRQAKLDVINKAMAGDKKTRIQYAAKQSSIANAWKKWIGQNMGLKTIDILKEKQKFEKKFQKWAKKTNNGSMYKNILSTYQEVETKIVNYQKAYYYFIECAYYSDVWRIYNSVYKRLDKISKEEDFEKIDSLKIEAVEAVDKMLKDYDPVIDEEIFTQMMLFYFSDVDENFFPAFYNDIQYKFNGDIKEYVHNLYEESVFPNQEKLKDFISKYYNGSSKYKEEYGENAIYTKVDLLKDPYLILFENFRALYIDKILPEFGSLSDQKDSLDHLYMKAQMEMQPNKIFYPDANFTLRVAYGSVKSFSSFDGFVYNYFTTLDGVIAKDNPEIYDYNVPEKLKELYNAKDYGKYADKDGKIHVCFIGDNHTSGGNSGSPVINANGELIGVNFDRCWESTMSDIKFDPNYCRNIMLDIRYVLFIVDKYAGAGYLIDEMQIVE
ncbi:MAG: S46 family peptidase [Bacteroidales bacterium]|nr:S46 family peptidase [Bacteroidales bacterium]